MFQKTTFELDPPNGLGSKGSYGGFSFGCAREPVDGKIKLVSSYHSCREGLMSNMRDRINGKSAIQPTDKMRMIFRLSAGTGKASDLKALEDWIARSVPVVRALDRLAGWPLTRAYKITTKHDEWLRAYYFHSSRRWMKSSYLVSMYVMLVRMCKDERVTGFKDFNGLKKVLETMFKKQQRLKNDHSYVRDSLPYWEAIMKGYPRLFRQFKMPYYWNTDRLNRGTSGSEGLQYLVNGDTSYTKVRKELLAIKSELDKKKKSK